jgi:hypothetical protein
MKQKVKEKLTEHPSAGGCNHYWVIEVANGPTSRGKCKYCGEVREFYNAFPDFNPLKKNKTVLHLPRLSGVEVDKDSKS